MNKIMPQLAATRETTTEDGFTDILTLDTASIRVEAAGYGSSSRTVTATRIYPNLSNADSSFIPKTITDGGRTFSGRRPGAFTTPPASTPPATLSPQNTPERWAGPSAVR